MAESAINDWWLSQEQRSMQPKLQVAEYVESQGIPVPKRYSSLGDALFILDNDGSLLLMSEHPDDYDGASGLFESFLLDNGIIEDGKRT